MKTNTAKVINAFNDGKILSVDQLKKMGVRNPSAQIYYMREKLGYFDVITSSKKGKTYYGFHSKS